ncbi:MAG: hypothetical protein JW395_4174 [Nitrospira sp.]|nr:hypothetical protein [Nitrospira sp.]
MARPQRVVLVVESPFSARDHSRYGVERLQQRGLSVDVWDISLLTAPRSRAQWIKTQTQINPTVICSHEELQALASGLSEQDVLVLSSLVYKRSNVASRALLTTLLKSSALATSIVSGNLPELSFTDRMHFRLATLMRNPHKVMKRLRPARRISKVTFWSQPSKQKMVGGTPMDRQLDIVWASTDVAQIQSEFFNERTVIRYIHTLDYDLILDLSPTAVSGEKFCVFLDAMGALHPDFYTLDQKNNLDMDVYSAIVCDHLAQIEGYLNIKSVIAAHPRAQPGVMEPWYGGRELIYGRTAQLICDSQMVVTVGDSTSISIAVALRQPISVITQLPLEPSAHHYRRAICRELRLSGRSLGRPKPGWAMPVPDSRAYSRYFDKYMKKPGTEHRHFWEVVADDILAADIQTTTAD